jgi:hypothetical protein
MHLGYVNSSPPRVPTASSKQQGKKKRTGQKLDAKKKKRSPFLFPNWKQNFTILPEALRT